YQLMNAEIYAWRGQEEPTRTSVKSLRQFAEMAGAASGVCVAGQTLAILELGLGRYAEALEAIEPLVADQQPPWTAHGLAIAIEAAARTQQTERANGYLAELERRAIPARTNWALGQLARCRAFVADDSEAEPLYLEAVAHLESTSVVTERALAQLAYGEW